MYRCLFLLILVLDISPTRVIAQGAPPAMTNADVVKMVKAGLPTDTVVAAIQRSTPKYDTSVEALIALKTQHIPTTVINAIIETQSTFRETRKSVSAGGGGSQELNLAQPLRRVESPPSEATRRAMGAASAGGVTRPRNGEWWRSLGPNDQRWFLTGMRDGFDMGFDFSHWGVKDESSIVPTIAESFNKYIQKYTQVQLDPIVDGLDAFYADESNRAIRARDATWVVLRKIAGDPPEEVKTLIENLRRNAKP